MKVNSGTPVRRETAIIWRRTNDFFGILFALLYDISLNWQPREFGEVLWTQKALFPTRFQRFKSAEINPILFKSGCPADADVYCF